MTPSSHERPSGSKAPSFPEPGSSPMAAAAPPERSQLPGGVGPSEGATVALAVGPSGQRSRSSSRLDQAKRQGTRSRATVGESDKGKARSSASSTGHKKSSREQRLESKGKLKSALSSARHRSSLTFVTIYSALSNSLDKLTGGKLRQRRSQEDAKTQLSSKPSKRVTISGVVELSGQGSQETSSVAPSAMESSGEQGPAGSGTAPQRESSPLPKAQSGGSRAVTAPSSPERSRASVGVGRSAVATASVGVGRSAVATASVAAGPSRLGSAQPSGMGGEMEPGRRSREPSVERSRAQLGPASPSTEQGRSRFRSPTGTPSQPGSSAVSRDSGAAGPSERSRVSVAAGPSERSRASVAAGPSEMATVSVAVGPSELGPRSSARPSGRDQLSLPGRGSRERSKAGSQSGSRISSPSAIREAGTPGAVAALGLEGDDVSRETSKKSRASVAPGSAEKSRALVAPASVGRSRASVAPSSAERSRASVAAGPSQLATVSVAVGRSEPGSLSSARTPGTDAQRAPRAGKSRLSSPCSGAPLGTKAGDASPRRSGEQSQSQAREEGGVRSQSPSSQAPHARAAVSKGQGPSSTRPSELDRQGELGWGSSRPSTTRSRSKGRQEDKRDPSVGHPASSPSRCGGAPGPPPPALPPADRALREKQRLIDSLTWELQREQQEADDLREELQLHKCRRGRPEGEPLPPSPPASHGPQTPAGETPEGTVPGREGFLVFCPPSCEPIGEDLELPLQITASPAPGPRSLEEELQEAIQKAQLVPSQSIEDILEEPLACAGDLLPTEPRRPPSPLSQQEAPCKKPRHTPPAAAILDFPGHYDFLTPPSSSSSSPSDSLRGIFSPEPPEGPPSPSPRPAFDPVDWLEALTAGPASGLGSGTPGGSSIFSTDFFDSPELSVNHMIDLMVEQW
ncbi:MEF2-activating motif and SAP domain-containing transcriptional regulator [Terrapene carolina triunguis]|uniref:MEF2-activating motif and SAP domain-containing transcriptional regulator n=1 Tax=Terrapene triunguis TaxID=2587831 RepID=UPI001156BA12|nr:MEF2-activating motif and SAP domain-containing transcriptional regulator [Terrapene carolina triunguis]